MLKRILSVAIASISGASFAQTSVTIYGIVDVAAMGTNQSGVKNPAGSQYGGNTFNLNNNSSLMGFKGAEDLGQGLKGIFRRKPPSISPATMAQAWRLELGACFLRYVTAMSN